MKYRTLSDVDWSYSIVNLDISTDGMISGALIWLESNQLRLYTDQHMLGIL